MAKRAEELRPVHDLVDDGRTGEEIARAVGEWLDELRSAMPIDLDVTAAAELAAARRDEDV